MHCPAYHFCSVVKAVNTFKKRYNVLKRVCLKTTEHCRTPQDAIVKTAGYYATNILKHPEEAINM